MINNWNLLTNRENALKSTGPKDTSLVKYNSLKHGLSAKLPVIPGEDPVEFQSFREGVIEDLQPQGVLQKDLVDRIVYYLWRLRRVERAETEFSGKLKFNPDFRNKIDWEMLLNSGVHQNLDRYAAHSLGMVSKLMTGLKRLQKGEEDDF